MKQLSKFITLSRIRYLGSFKFPKASRVTSSLVDINLKLHTH